MIAEITELEITGKIGARTVPSRLGVKTSLGPITALLDRLGHPERSFPAVHIGGTSGKGSTSTFLANILTAAGMKTGLFTKPHLSTVRERFVIDGSPVSPHDMVALIEAMPALADGDEKPTWFELMTAMAFQYFAQEHVDIAVIEVGLGGTYDATNVIDPLLSLLTNVGLDHTDILGDTVEKIAMDKTGIFKPGRPVVSGVSQPAVIDIVNSKAQEVDSALALLERDFHYTNAVIRPDGGSFDFSSADETISGLSIAMPGIHQIANAALAVAAALALCKADFPIPTPAIRAGLRATRAPGRMEVLRREPLVILDGAHSPPKMEALASSLRALFLKAPDGAERNVTGVLSFSLGHDAAATLAPLAPLLDTAILTEFTAETDYGNKRAQDPGEVAGRLQAMNPAVRILLEPDPVQAIQVAMAQAGPNGLICVTGSIFLVGQVRDFLTTSHGV